LVFLAKIINCFFDPKDTTLAMGAESIIDSLEIYSY